MSGQGNITFIKNRAFLYSGWTLGTITGFYVPFHLLTKTSIPSSSMKEGLPGTPYFELALCNTDTYNAIGIFAVPIFGFSMATWVSMLGDTVEKYAVKCQYNVDSELLFVWFCDKLGNEVKLALLCSKFRSKKFMKWSI